MKRPTRLALLSHRGENIGHDFMASGWEHIARTAFGDTTELVHVEQHRPFDIYPRTSRTRLRAQLPGAIGRHEREAAATPGGASARWPKATALPRVDLAVACGGPNIAPGVGAATEMRLMFPHLHGAFASRGIPVVDAAVGSAFPLEHVPERIDDPADRAYFEWLFSVTSRSTVRDALAQALWAELGRPADLIPCGALALRGDRPPGAGGTTVIVNFQEAGANTDWAQGVDRARWASEFGEVVRRLRSRHEVVALCHNRWEQRLAGRVLPGVPAVVPTSTAAFLELAATAGAALVNRLHAAIGLAGAGVASVVVGTDTRLGTVREMGLPTHYVKDVTPDELEDEVEAALRARSTERERLAVLRDHTVQQHVDVLRSAVS